MKGTFRRRKKEEESLYKKKRGRYIQIKELETFFRCKIEFDSQQKRRMKKVYGSEEPGKKKWKERTKEREKEKGKVIVRTFGW